MQALSQVLFLKLGSSLIERVASSYFAATPHAQASKNSRREMCSAEVLARSRPQLTWTSGVFAYGSGSFFPFEVQLTASLLQKKEEIIP